MTAISDDFSSSSLVPDRYFGDDIKALIKDATRQPLLLAELYFRMVEIGATVGKHTFRYSRDRVLKTIGLPWAGRRIVGQRLKTEGRRLVNVFEDLGPTFIKIGQVLSTRPDLVSEMVAAELRLLQDKVAPFPFAEAVKTIEEDFDCDIDDLFSEIDPVPVAAASVAQVHRAVIKGGGEAAVKVQRPNVYDRARKDLIILRIFFGSIEKVIPHFRNLSTKDSVQEIGTAIERQLDFLLEVDNNKRFAKNFADDDWIYFPKVFDDLCSRRVMTMEFIHGSRGDRPDLVGVDPKKIARLGLKALVKMVFVDGFLHCDPHPGNIFLVPDGRIVFIDLGLAAELTKEVQNNLFNLIVALVSGNIESTAELFLKTCDEVNQFNYEAYVRDIGKLIETHLQTTISQMEATLIFKNLFEIVWKHNLKLNSDYALVFMALITVEGLGKSLDPSLDLMGELQVIMAELLAGGS